MNILYLVSWFAASFSSTHSLRETPGEWARHGLHCCPIGIWSINFPPEATLPPAGPPVGLLFSTEQLMMDFGRSVFFCTIEADELLLLLLLSAEHPVSNSVKASRWDTIFSESKHDFTGVTRRDKHVDLPTLFWVPSTSTSPSSLIGSLWRRHPHHCTELAKECEWVGAYFLLPVILLQCHALLIHWPLYFTLAGEDTFMLQDDALHQVVNQSLQGDGIVLVGPSYKAGAKAHSQVVRLHHILITVLRHTVEQKKPRLNEMLPLDMSWFFIDI